MVVRTAPCEWPLAGSPCTALDALEHGEGEGENEDSLADLVRAAAVELLWNWTGRAFGLCPVVLRPCREDCPDNLTTYRGAAGVDQFLPRVGAWTPALIGGAWFNIRCGMCGDRCSCSKVEQLKLPGPVASIDKIHIDGELLEASAYRVDNHNLLVRDDGGEWPRCQDLSEPAGEEGTWTIAYQLGVQVPKGGQIAAGTLACEMAKSINRDKSCQLPVRVQNITREGITIGAVLDSFDDLERGRTGLWLVDSWVASITAPDRRSTIHFPGQRKVRHTTYRGGV